MSEYQSTHPVPAAGPSHAARRVGYVAAIVLNVILMYVFSSLLGWHVPFLTPAFAAVLGVLMLSMSVSIVVNLAYIVYDATWFRRLGDIVTTTLGLVVMWTAYTIFPFDLPAGLNSMARLSLILVMAAMGIALLVQAVLFLKALVAPAEI